MTIISANKCWHGWPLDECGECRGLLTVTGQQQGLGGARIVRENETDDEKAARLRQERFERVGVVEAPAYMPEDRYRGEYLGRMWYMSEDVMHQAEECLRICHCHKCADRSKPPRIEATRFFVRFEDDPMQNYPALAHLTCHRCGFEEYYPLRMDPRKLQAQNADAKFVDTQMRQKLADEKLAALQKRNEELIRKMAQEAAKRIGIPLMPDEANAMRRILERELGQQNMGRGVQNMLDPSPSLPDFLYGDAKLQKYEQIARSISDPDSRRAFVNRILKEQGKL